MARKTKRFYTVWKGWTPGVFDSWTACEASIHGYSGAVYKAFPTRAAAEAAFRTSPEEHIGTGEKSPGRSITLPPPAGASQPILNSLCVDAACDMTARIMEYRGVWLHSGETAFTKGPFPGATNNLGEFLAIVHGLAMLADLGLDWPIYSDSKTAIGWVEDGKANSDAIKKGQTSTRINDLVARAEKWLATHEYSNPLLKWETKLWGENPADFGRK